MKFGAYIVTTSKGIDISDYDKKIIICSRSRLVIHATIQIGENYCKIIACFEARVKAETALGLNAE
jgi:hypothetical protein